MSNDNAFLNEEESAQESSESFDFDELEAKLQGQLEDELAGFEFLQEEKDKIGSPDALGETIKDVVWEQFINQIAAKAGEDFIKENNSLKLDLRKEAHIQTTENFAKGKIATVLSFAALFHRTCTICSHSRMCFSSMALLS